MNTAQKRQCVCQIRSECKDAAKIEEFKKQVIARTEAHYKEYEEAKNTIKEQKKQAM